MAVEVSETNLPQSPWKGKSALFCGASTTSVSTAPLGPFCGSVFKGTVTDCRSDTAVSPQECSLELPKGVPV